ncbi:hypothetical protein [Sphingomonas floccifaciens]|uniref:hypothetical protein n=1 Tax=Sphingomonas floccifaciens TaxID=1844115 RepID=UPI0036D2D27F
MTASDLVRHFGAWRDRAMNTPVYIHHHGKPKLVLTSVDFIDALSAAKAPGGTNDAAMATLLEMIDASVVVTDQALMVNGTNALARQRIGRADWQGLPLADIVPEAVRPFLLRAADVTLASGQVERLHLRLGDHGERKVDVAIYPFQDGVCIIGRDQTAPQALALAQAHARIVDEMLGLIGTTAWVRMNPRGYVTDVSSAFEAMTGLPPEACRHVRLPTLFDPATHAFVDAALDRAIDSMANGITSARLLTSSVRAVPVRVAISGKLLRMSEDAVIATISLDAAALPTSS